MKTIRKCVRAFLLAVCCVGSVLLAFTLSAGDEIDGRGLFTLLALSPVTGAAFHACRWMVRRWPDDAKDF